MLYMSLDMLLRLCSVIYKSCCAVSDMFVGWHTEYLCNFIKWLLAGPIHLRHPPIQNDQIIEYPTKKKLCNPEQLAWTLYNTPIMRIIKYAEPLTVFKNKFERVYSAWMNHQFGWVLIIGMFASLIVLLHNKSCVYFTPFVSRLLFYQLQNKYIGCTMHMHGCFQVKSVIDVLFQVCDEEIMFPANAQS